MASAEDSVQLVIVRTLIQLIQIEVVVNSLLLWAVRKLGKGTDNISIGHKAETDSSGDSIAMGRESKANQANAIAVGRS